jgi:RimJ/RimL family protein N-acetyltransferase
MEIRTERLVLRDFVPDDSDAYFAVQNDPRWLRYYEWTERSRADASELFERFIGWQREDPRIKFQLAVTLDGRVIGSCGARMDEPGADEAELGYEIHPDLWRNGYATEAGRAMVRFAFDELGVSRMRSWCIAENVGSAAVLRKVGFHQTERRKDAEFFKGRHWDTLRFELRP